jgi:hypothetical protein
MSKKRKPQNKKAWESFELTVPVFKDEEWVNSLDDELSNAYKMQREEFESGATTMWFNNIYTVHRKIEENGFTWLSIRRNDRKPIRDWRHFQRIKNELVGSEREALELFPAESRLVDEANQYHLWVLPEGESIPVGWNIRMVGGSEEASVIGAVQRDLDVE